MDSACHSYAAAHLLALDVVKLDPEFNGDVVKRASSEGRDGGVGNLAVKAEGVGGRPRRRAGQPAAKVVDGACGVGGTREREVVGRLPPDGTSVALAVVAVARAVHHNVPAALGLKVVVEQKPVSVCLGTRGLGLYDAAPDLERGQLNVAVPR